jgi:AcrR family transcriptional regulator
VESEPVRRKRLTQAESREQTRRQLLAAAAEVFAEKGFAGASLEEIADRAGYTTGAVYYHFGNKDKLFLELIGSGWSRRNAGWVDTVTEVFAGVEPDPENPVTPADGTADPYAVLARLLLRRADRRAESGPLAGEFWLYALRNADGMAVLAEKLREQIEGLTPVFAAAMERAGTPPGIVPEEMTTIALALFQGLSRRRSIDPASVPDDLFAKVLRRLMEP